MRLILSVVQHDKGGFRTVTVACPHLRMARKGSVCGIVCGVSRQEPQLLAKCLADYASCRLYRRAPAPIGRVACVFSPSQPCRLLLAAHAAVRVAREVAEGAAKYAAVITERLYGEAATWAALAGAGEEGWLAVGLDGLEEGLALGRRRVIVFNATSLALREQKLLTRLLREWKERGGRGKLIIIAPPELAPALRLLGVSVEE